MGIIKAMVTEQRQSESWTSQMGAIPRPMRLYTETVIRAAEYDAFLATADRAADAVQGGELRRLLILAIALSPKCEPQVSRRGGVLLPQLGIVVSDAVSHMISRHLRVEDTSAANFDRRALAVTGGDVLGRRFGSAVVPALARAPSGARAEWLTHPYLDTAERCALAGDGRLAAWWVNRHVDMHVRGVDLSSVAREACDRDVRDGAWKRRMVLRRLLSESDDRERVIDEVNGVAREVRVGSRFAVERGRSRAVQGQRNRHNHPRVAAEVDGLLLSTFGNHSAADLVVAAETGVAASEVVYGRQVEVVEPAAGSTFDSAQLTDDDTLDRVLKNVVPEFVEAASSPGAVVGAGAETPYDPALTATTAAQVFTSRTVRRSWFRIPDEIDRCPWPRPPTPDRRKLPPASTRRGLG